MKKFIYTLPILVLGLLSSCYDSDYTSEEMNRMVGEMKTLPAKIDEANQTISLGGQSWNDSYLYFQICRSKDFSNEETYNIDYEAAQNIPLGSLSGTYYFRAVMAGEGDSFFAPNVESFTVGNTLSISSVNPIKDTTYQFECTSDYYWSTYFRMSTDADFKEYLDYYAAQKDYDESLKYYEYYGIAENLSHSTTYYVKAVRDVILGTVESKVESFTTNDFLKMGEVTYTGWDGKTYPMTEGYDHFIANYLYNGEVIDRNIEIYRTENGWKLAKDLVPNGSGVLYGFFSYGNQNYDNEIEIQTYKYDNPTLMWGVAEEDNGVFNINLRNMLSRVVFHLTVSNDYPEDKPEVGEFTIKSNSLPSFANFQVNNGTFAYNQWSFSEPLGYWNRIGLCKGETVDLVLYSIPSRDAGKATVSMSFMYNTIEYSDIDIDWKSGNTYEYYLTVTATGLSISDVIVNEWQPIEGGSIIINPNK